MKTKKSKREIELEQCIRQLVSELRTQTILAKNLGGEIAINEGNQVVWMKAQKLIGPC